jgi:cell division protein FtsZ
MAWSAADEAASSVTASPVVAGTVIEDEEPSVTSSDLAGDRAAETVDATGTTAEDAGGSEAVSSDGSSDDGAGHDAPASSTPSQSSASSHGASSNGASSSSGGSTGRTFDVATTRRRPVIFEEDDDLDVPDFLK